MNYGQNMRNIRDLYELTQQDVANILHIARSTYKQYEMQYDIIPIKHLNNFCNHFNVSFDYMFNFTIKKKYNDEIKEISTEISGKRIKSLRKEFKLTQDKLARKLNVANTIICEYERGHHLISTATLYALSKEFKISSDYLLGKTNEIKHLETKKALVVN